MTAFPKTLLQLAGVSPAPSPLADSALVLIDAQLEYVCGAVPLVGIDAAVAQAVRLLGMARARDVPVFHIVHLAKPRAAAFDPLGWHVAIIPELVPVEGEKVVVKSLPNAFAGTTLDDAIRATGRRELIIAGFATHMCVSATTRAALDLGYRSTVVAGATATRDLPNPLGRGVTPAAVVQEGTLAALADRFAVIVPDADALDRADRASIELNAGVRSCG